MRIMAGTTPRSFERQMRAWSPSSAREDLDERGNEAKREPFNAQGGQECRFDRELRFDAGDGGA
jgi:hypothetical protein